MSDLKTRLAEYRDIDHSQMAQRATFAEKYSDKVRAKVAFSYVSHGWEPAGSVAKWTEGYYSVRWQDHSGAFQGRRYVLTKTGRDHAEAHFNRLVTGDSHA